ncbi:hypothetical protein [Bradyrhizobium sp. dw_78]|uniref:hypothetical protein n=1 Tax=Bradyrhizobium sp. dw_78 TaxID=2719793 RepID=UPI001BD5D8B5|nr:hypothetical protein [Bradyrhizobium sp. dw_78]
MRQYDLLRPEYPQIRQADSRNIQTKKSGTVSSASESANVEQLIGLRSQHTPGNRPLELAQFDLVLSRPGFIGDQREEPFRKRFLAERDFCRSLIDRDAEAIGDIEAGNQSGFRQRTVDPVNATRHRAGYEFECVPYARTGMAADNGDLASQWKAIGHQRLQRETDRLERHSQHRKGSLTVKYGNSCERNFDRLFFAHDRNHGTGF